MREDYKYLGLGHAQAHLRVPLQLLFCPYHPDRVCAAEMGPAVNGGVRMRWPGTSTVKPSPSLTTL
jgi:hypothetical protein